MLDVMLRFRDPQIEKAFWLQAKQTLLAVDRCATLLVVGALLYSLPLFGQRRVTCPAF